MTIATRIRILMVALALTIVSCLGAVGLWGFRSIVQHVQVDSLRANVGLEASRLRYAFGELEHDIRLLEGLPALKWLASTQSDAQHTRGKEHLDQVLLKILGAKPSYAQIRILEPTPRARELVRVDRTLRGLRSAPARELQDKGNRDYVREALARPPGTIHISDITLNQENGRIETPHRPMIRAVSLALTSKGEPLALVVINQDFQQMMRGLVEPNGALSNYYLANESGDYLAHPEPDKTFGFELGKRFTVQDEFPRLEAEQAPDGQGLSRRLGFLDRDSLFYMERVFVFGAEDPRFVSIGLSAAQQQVNQQLAVLARNSGFVALALLLLALVVAVHLAGLVTKPLSQITREAEKIAAGGLLPSLPTGRRDEIGSLSRGLETMLQTLRENERHLAQANAELAAKNNALEQFAHIASHDLREPATRIASFSELAVAAAGSSVTGPAVRWLERLAVAARQLMNQVSDLRAFSEVSDGELVRRPVDIAELFEQLAASRIGDTSLSVTVTRGARGEVLAYEHLVSVLLRELIDATDGSGGQLVLTGEVGAVGGGRPRLWQVQYTVSSEQPGTIRPLPRALCERIVARHGGLFQERPHESGFWFHFSLEPDPSAYNCRDQIEGTDRHAGRQHGRLDDR